MHLRSANSLEHMMSVPWLQGISNSQCTMSNHIHAMWKQGRCTKHALVVRYRAGIWHVTARHCARSKRDTSCSMLVGPLQLWHHVKGGMLWFVLQRMACHVTIRPLQPTQCTIVRGFGTLSHSRRAYAIVCSHRHTACTGHSACRVAVQLVHGPC